MDASQASSRTVAAFLVFSSRVLRTLASATGLSFVQLLLVRNLAARGPRRIGEASDDLALADGVMTGVVDRLEERELVIRRTDPTDRRAIIIELTDRGESLARTTLRPYEEAVRDIFSDMDPDAVRRFVEGMERLAAGEAMSGAISGVMGPEEVTA